MGEPALQVPSSHLTRKLARRSLGGSNPLSPLIDFLCTDTLYSFKDDFDRGLDPRIWTVAHEGAQQEGTGLQDFDAVDEDGGWLVGNPGGDDDANVRVFSRGDVWSPLRRCTVQGRFNVQNKSDLKFEFGFVSPSEDLGNPNLAGAVNVKATPTANLLGFALSILDSDDNTNCDLVLARNSSVAATDQNGGPTVTDLLEPFTILVTMVEDGGASYWIDGALAGVGHIQPLTVTAFHGTTGTLAANQASRESSLDRGLMSIWLHVQNRASSSTGHDMWVDYIQAWQERADVQS